MKEIEWIRKNHSKFQITELISKSSGNKFSNFVEIAPAMIHIINHSGSIFFFIMELSNTLFESEIRKNEIANAV